MASYGVYDSTQGTTTDRTLIRWGDCPAGEETLQGYNTNEVGVALSSAVNCTMDQEAHYNGTTGVITITSMTKATSVQKQEQLVTRNSLLTFWDWFMTADASTRLSYKKLKEIKKYRQDLRNVPQQGGYPSSIVWPTVPTPPTPIPDTDPLSLIDSYGNLISGFTFTRSTSALTYSKQGWMKLAGVNVPRVEYNPADGTLRGLLMEPARTNLLLWCYTFTNAVWTATRATVAAASQICPDATIGGYKITEDTTATNTHIISQTITLAAASNYYRTIVLKAGTRTGASIFTTSPGMTNVNVVVDLSAGSIISGTAIISALKAGWYMVQIPFTTVTGGASTISTRLYNGNAIYTGDGTSGLYVFQDQVELGDFPTSLINTTTAAATRGADSATLPLTDFYNDNAGTWYAEANYIGGSDKSNDSRTVFSLDDGSTANQIYVDNKNGYHGCQITAASASQMSVNGNSANDSLYHQVTLGYSLNDGGICNDGVNITTDTTLTVPNGLTTLRVGGQFTAGKELGGFIRDLKYWDSKLRSDQIIAATT